MTTTARPSPPGLRTPSGPEADTCAHLTTWCVQRRPPPPDSLPALWYDHDAMRTVLAMALACGAAACGQADNGWQVSATPAIANPDVAALTLTGLPVDEASVRRVIERVEELSGRHAAAGLSVDVTTDPKPCGDVGLRDGCATLVDGAPHIVVDTRYDTASPLISVWVGAPNYDMTCTYLAHEIVHHLFGDGAHSRPELWYADDALVRRVLTSFSCPIYP